MKVKELIEKLQLADQELDVLMYYDGAPYLICDSAYVSTSHEIYDYKNTKVLVLCEYEDVYDFDTINDYWIFKNEK